MSDRTDFPFWGRSVLGQIVFSLCFVLGIVSLMMAPLSGAGQKLEQAQTIQFQGHQVSTATKADFGRGESWKGPPGSTEPAPIPGGLVLPPVIHVYAPGPVNQGFQGLDIEPSVITNYRGFTAIGYPGGFGTATDGSGNSYDVVTDMRVFHGEYVSTDGTHHRGTFAFI